jgi:hypothetical protein
MTQGSDNLMIYLFNNTVTSLDYTVQWLAQILLLQQNLQLMSIWEATNFFNSFLKEKKW